MDSKLDSEVFEIFENGRFEGVLIRVCLGLIGRLQLRWPAAKEQLLFSDY